jgi:hypothetical protein
MNNGQRSSHSKAAMPTTPEKRAETAGCSRMPQNRRAGAVTRIYAGAPTTSAPARLRQHRSCSSKVMSNEHAPREISHTTARTGVGPGDIPGSRKPSLIKILPSDGNSHAFFVAIRVQRGSRHPWADGEALRSDSSTAACGRQRRNHPRRMHVDRSTDRTRCDGRRLLWMCCVAFENSFWTVGHIEPTRLSVALNAPRTVAPEESFGK